MRKHNLKKKNAKLVVGALATTTLALTGCSNDLDIPVNEIKPSEISPNNAVSMRMYLSESDRAYIDFIGKLVGQLIENPQSGKEFIQNPNSYIKQFGFEGNLTLSRKEKCMQVIEALSDPEIREQLSSNDMGAFIRLCKNKGYAMNYSSNYLEWVKTGTTDLISHNPQNKSAFASGDVEVEFPFFVAYPVMSWYEFYHYYKWYWSTEVYINAVPEVPTEAYVDVLRLTKDEKTCFFVCEENINKEVETIINFYKEANPELTLSQETELTNFFKKNLTHWKNNQN